MSLSMIMASIKNRVVRKNERSDILGSVDNTPITITCPSCKGIGRIPREYESQMVALIPADDSRLKPRRTVLYISISFLICVVIGALMTFFLVSRNIDMNSYADSYTSIIRTNDTDQTMNITLMAHYTFSNWNYLPVTISKLNVLALYDIYQGGNSINTTTVIAHMRQHLDHYVQVNISFKGTPLNNYLYEVCTYRKYIPVNFYANATVSYFAHTEELSLVTTPWIQCSYKLR